MSLVSFRLVLLVGAAMQFSKLLMIGVTITLMGCATKPLPIYKFSKPGATYDQYLKDRYACILDARKQVSGGYFQDGTGASASDQQISGPIVFACLAARGWIQDPNGFGPPPGGVVPLSR